MDLRARRTRTAGARDGGIRGSRAFRAVSGGRARGGIGGSSFAAPVAAPVAAGVVAIALAGGIVATGTGERADGSDGADGGRVASSSEGADTRTTEARIDFAALVPAAGDAMGERDFGGLRDPGLAAECLAQHGEDMGALLGAAPVAHGGGVAQLFVLSAGMPGRVSVLLTVNDCGGRPADPIVHREIGAPG